MAYQISIQQYREMYSVIGIAIEVYNTFKRALEEPIYQEAMELEADFQNIPLESQKQLNIWYKGKKMKKFYIADLYYRGIIIELKSVDRVIAEHRAQLFNYMRITKTYCGLLINFGEKSLRTERYIYQPDEDDFILLTKANYKDYIKQE